MASKNYAEAEGFFRLSLAAVDSSTNSKDRVSILTKLAYSCAEQGRIREAEDFYNQAIAACEAAYGPDSEQSLSPIEGLRRLQYQHKQYDKCEATARNALRIADSKLAVDDPRIEFAINNVISVACLNGVCKDESGLLARLLDARERRFGPDSIQTCTARQLAAEGHIKHKKYKQAAQLYERNVQAYQRVAPHMVPAARALYANALYRDGQFARALPELQAALQAERQAPQRYASQFVSSLALLGDLNDALGKAKEAEQGYEEMARACDQIFGPKSNLTADYLVRYAEFLKKQHQDSKAAQIDKKIKSIYAARV